MSNTHTGVAAEKDKLHQEIIDLIKVGGEAVEKSRDKNIVLILGNTGCGKSTTINYLVGCTMIKVEDPETREFTIESPNGVTEIGAGAVSKTLYPNIVGFLTPCEYDFEFADTAGFIDNRGAAHDICAAYCLGQVFELSKSLLGIIVIIPEADFKDPRLNAIRSLFNLLNRCLSSESFRGSITFFITKDSGEKEPKHLRATMKRAYEELKKDTTSEIDEITWIFEEFLALKEDGLPQNIHFCRPLDSDDRENLLRVISSLQAVRNKSSAFNYPISSDTRFKVKSVIEIMERTAVNLLNNLILTSNNQVHNEIGEYKYLNDIYAFMSKLNECETIIKTLSACDTQSYISLLERAGIVKNEHSELDTTLSQINILKRCSDIQRNESGQVIGAITEVPAEVIALTTAHVNNYKQALINREIMILGDALEERFMQYDVQRIVANDRVYNKFREIERKTSYNFSDSDFTIFYDLGVQKDTLFPIIKNLTRGELGSNGMKRIMDAISRCILNPFMIPLEANNRQFVITANIKNIAMSTLVPFLKARNLSQISFESIWILAKDTIFMDDDIGMGIAGGKNVVLACDKIIVSNNAKINTSGFSPDVSAKMDGLYGVNGESAGNIHILANTIEGLKLTAVLNGGNGSDGADGADGADGETGKNGTDAEYVSGYGAHMDKGELKWGSSGLQGGKGLDGGNAGSGGLGGKKGTLVCKTGLLKKISVTAKDGVRGKNGIIGKGGQGGKGGYNGYNTISYQPDGLSPMVYATGYFTSWKSGYYFLGYNLTWSGGLGVEGKIGGPPRTYADQGGNGNAGIFCHTPYALKPQFATIGLDTIQSAYDEYIASI